MMSFWEICFNAIIFCNINYHPLQWVVVDEFSEQEALDAGMHHSKTEGPTKKTYFTQKELDERNKKDTFVSGTTNLAPVDSGSTSQGILPHTGDVPVPVPLASASMGLGAFLLAWLKKRKKKRQKRLAD